MALGVWTLINPTRRPWSKYKDSAYDYATFENNTSQSLVIKSVTISLASGSGNVYGGGDAPYTLINGNGSSFNATLVINGSNLATSSVTQSVGVSSQGDESTSGYFNDIRSSTYYVTFTSSAGIVVTAGSTVSVKVKRVSGDSSGSNAPIMVYGPKVLASSVVKYQGSLTKPTVSIDKSTIYYKDTVTVSHNGSGYDYAYDNSQWSSGPGSKQISLGDHYRLWLRSYNYNSDYDPSTVYSDTLDKPVKLLKPTLTTPGTQFTVGTQVKFSTSTSGNGQPSGVTYSLEGSVDKSDWNWGQSSLTVGLVSSRYYRVVARCSNFTSSDPSDPTPLVEVLYAPRSMKDNGFTVHYRSQESSTGQSVEIVESSVVVPGRPIEVEYSAFSKSKNLGLFNKLTYKLVDESGTLLQKEDLDNDPESTGSVTIPTVPAYAGKRCRVVLECWCRYLGTTEGPLETAIFTSPLFLIGGQPYTELIYPYTTEDSQGRQIFYSASEQPRLTFKVGNDDAMFNAGENIEDIVVELYGTTSSGSRVQLGVYKYSNESHRQYFWSKCPSEVKPFPITETQSATMDFRLPTRLGETNTYDFTVYCKNSALESDKIKFYFKPTPLNFMKSGSLLKESDRHQLISTAFNQITGYSTLDATLTNAINYLLSPEDADRQGQIISEDLFVQSRKNLIRNLQLLYEEVFKVSAPIQSINFDEIDDITHNLTITADSQFQVEDNFYVPLGNYFNYVIYVLKYML